MKKITSFFTASLLIACASVFVSCLGNDEETEYSSDCYISAFKLGTVKRTVTKLVDGKDSTYSYSLAGSYYPMSIDQINRVIFNSDSLPYGCNVASVLATVTGNGYVYYRKAVDKDSVFTTYSSSDSIDFTSPLEFLVVGLDGIHKNSYTVKVNVHQQDGEKFMWNKMCDLQALETFKNMKMVCHNGNLLLYGMNEEKIVSYSSLLTDGAQWHSVALNGVENMEVNSVQQKVDCLFASTTDGKVISSTDGQNWTMVNASNCGTLVGSDGIHLFAIKEGAIYASVDGVVWDVETLDSNGSFLPSYNSSSVSYVNAYQQCYTVLSGVVGPNDTRNRTWCRLPNNGNVWSLYDNESNQYECPHLNSLGIIYYDNQLLGVGFSATNNMKPMVYSSSDNGVSWKESTTYSLPSDLLNTNGAMTVTVDKNQFIWLVSNNGIWRGRLNRLGFAQQ